MSEFACIFDLDGVIVDTARFHYLAWKRLANELGFDFTEQQNEALKGVSRRESLEIILKWGNKTLSESDFLHWLDVKNRWYLDYVMQMDETSPLPGVREFLGAVRNAGYRTALGSASKNAGTILDITGLTGYFEVVIDGNKTTRSKPDPQVFALCAEALGVDPSQCVVFEDAEAGIEAALAAGMKTIGVGEASNLPKVGLVISGLHEMTLERLPFSHN